MPVLKLSNTLICDRGDYRTKNKGLEVTVRIVLVYELWMGALVENEDWKNCCKYACRPSDIGCSLIL